MIIWTEYIILDFRFRCKQETEIMTEFTPKYSDEQLQSDAVSKKDIVNAIQEHGSHQVTNQLCI